MLEGTHHIMLVRNKPYRVFDKHRMIILATYSQYQTGLEDVGSPLIIFLIADVCKPHRVNMMTEKPYQIKDTGLTQKSSKEK